MRSNSINPVHREADINSRYAAFVDAGHFFTEAGKSLTGRTERRRDLRLDAAAVLSTLKDTMQAWLPGRELLRVYWYDGSLGGIRNEDHTVIASLDDVKIRLGFVNESGEQKGVDTLIVTDLIELARLNAIGDAFLVAGDEDVRIGVQIAQNYGVRVHLLGIESGVQSRSERLFQEADRIVPSLTREQIGRFLQYNPQDNERVITEAVREFIDNLTPEERDDLRRRWKLGDNVIPESFDRQLLPHCRNWLGRFLSADESKLMRSCFWRCLVAAPPA